MKRFFTGIIVMAMILGGCGNNPTEQASPEAQPPVETQAASEEPAAPPKINAGERLNVVTTIFPPYDFVREIAGDKVDLMMLLPPGSESHSYEPSPQDIIKIQDCDVFIYVGGESDSWVGQILDSVDTGQMTLLPMLRMVDAVQEELVEGMEGSGHSHSAYDDDYDYDYDDHDHDDDHDDHDDHDHDDDDNPNRTVTGELDEHVWTSPENAKEIAEEISETLRRLDPANGEFYRQNEDAYKAQLEQLDDEFESIVRQGNRRTLVFGDRFPLRYFADEYNLEYYAAFPGCSTETEPSAQTVAFLIDKIKAEGIPVVFHIEFSNERMADTISEATGAKKELFHSCHNVSKDDIAAGVSYLQLMKQNAAVLKEALQ